MNVNDIFEMKYMIEYLGDELTRSITIIGLYLKSIYGLAYDVYQGQRTRFSSDRNTYNKQINKSIAAWQLKLLIVLQKIKVLVEQGQ